jgi:hypothetical protein
MSDKEINDEKRAKAIFMEEFKKYVEELKQKQPHSVAQAQNENHVKHMIKD